MILLLFVHFSICLCFYPVLLVLSELLIKFIRNRTDSLNIHLPYFHKAFPDCRSLNEPQVIRQSKASSLICPQWRIWKLLAAERGLNLEQRSPSHSVAARCRAARQPRESSDDNLALPASLLFLDVRFFTLTVYPYFTPNLAVCDMAPTEAAKPNHPPKATVSKLPRLPKSKLYINCWRKLSCLTKLRCAHPKTPYPPSCHSIPLRRR